MVVVAETKMDVVATQAALLGVATPFSTALPPLGLTGPVLAIVEAHLGTLAADPSAGATVRGSGSAMLRISGTAAQVNAKLAALTYLGRLTGTDTLAITLVDGQGRVTTAVQMPVAVVALASGANTSNAVVGIEQGTLTLDTRVIDGPAIAIDVPSGSQNATTAILINATIGVHSALSVRNKNEAGGVMPRLAVAGQVELAGSTSFGGHGAAVLLARGASLVNEGSITIGAHAAQFSGAGTVVNDGSITIGGDPSGDDAGEPPVRIATEIAGSGQIALTAGASLSLDGPVGAGETVLLGAGDTVLHLAQPGAFSGLIAGFAPGDTIVLDGVSVGAAFYDASAEADHGTLRLFAGSSAIGSLRFGATANGAFELGTDPAGSTTIRLAAARPSASIGTDVFRFFDATNGTQLLTQDRGERDTILADRSDLRYEGVAFKAVHPAEADLSDAPVYRFFDLRTGTHFMTASADERDVLLGSRHDLVFEPESTIFEHATAQAGDVAVFRFFDQGTGAHVFTADAGERATILATRSDMTFEGVAFYAPSA